MTRRSAIIVGICFAALFGLSFWQTATRIPSDSSPLGRATHNSPNALIAAQPAPQEGVIDVRSYGAVGDAVADDTHAIQAAESALSEGDTLVFSKGTYRITDTITVDVNGVIVRFDDASIYVRGNTDAFRVKATGVKFLGGEIYSDGQAVGHGMYGINLLGDNCIVDGTRIHHIHASAVVSRGVNNVIRNIRVENVGWDMGLCRGGSKRTIWENCWCNNVGRSAVACDDKAETMQIVGCSAVNPGNTTYVNQQHNVFHFEDCNDGLVKNCTVRYTAAHD
jgi:polygalacturonase